MPTSTDAPKRSDLGTGTDGDEDVDYFQTGDLITIWDESSLGGTVQKDNREVLGINYGTRVLTSTPSPRVGWRLVISFASARGRPFLGLHGVGSARCFWRSLTVPHPLYCSGPMILRGRLMGVVSRWKELTLAAIAARSEVVQTVWQDLIKSCCALYETSGMPLPSVLQAKSTKAMTTPVWRRNDHARLIWSEVSADTELYSLHFY